MGKWRARGGSVTGEWKSRENTLDFLQTAIHTFPIGWWVFGGIRTKAKPSALALAKGLAKINKNIREESHQHLMNAETQEMFPILQ